jgi:hypothetical protein
MRVHTRTHVKVGLKTAVQELHDPAAPVPGSIDGPQLDMLPLGNKAAEKNLAVARGRGRPPGAKNKNTEQWRDYILSRYSSPLEALAFTVSMPLDELAKTLSCPKVEAFKIQMMAATQLAPYLHQKMPLALDTGNAGLVHLTLNLTASAQQMGPEATGQVIEILNSKPQQNQLVTAQDLDNSNSAASNGHAQTPDNKGENNDATN